MPEKSGSDLYGTTTLNKHGSLATPYGYPCDPPSGDGSGNSTALHGQDVPPFNKPESGNILVGVRRDDVGGQGPGPGKPPGDMGALATPMYGEAKVKGLSSSGDGFGQKGKGGFASPFDTVFGE